MIKARLACLPAIGSLVLVGACSSGSSHSVSATDSLRQAVITTMHTTSLNLVITDYLQGYGAGETARASFDPITGAARVVRDPGVGPTPQGATLGAVDESYTRGECLGASGSGFYDCPPGNAMHTLTSDELALGADTSPGLALASLQAMQSATRISVIEGEGDDCYEVSLDPAEYHFGSSFDKKNLSATAVEACIQRGLVSYVSYTEAEVRVTLNISKKLT